MSLQTTPKSHNTFGIHELKKRWWWWLLDSAEQPCIPQHLLISALDHERKQRKAKESKGKQRQAKESKGKQRKAKESKGKQREAKESKGKLVTCTSIAHLALRTPYTHFMTMLGLAHRVTKVLTPSPSVCSSQTGRVLQCHTRQVAFFKKVDTCVVDADVLNVPEELAQRNATDNAWADGLEACTSSLRSREVPVRPSHVRVIEAALYLMQSGLLNVKGTRQLNIKQCRAVLHWAWWLQQKMSQKWLDEEVVGNAPFRIAPFVLCHVLTGGAGSGKTTTLRVVEALLDFFLGSESLMKSAPTNTAARLLNGDTTHATYKLPRGSLLCKRAQLSTAVLRQLRRRWASASAHAIDEISVLPPHALFHVDMRARQAKQREHDVFGGLGTCASGDFMQLPPVDEPSLALPLDDTGYAKEFEEVNVATPREQDGNIGGQDSVSSLSGLHRAKSAFWVCIFKSRVVKSRAYWVVWDRRAVVVGEGGAWWSFGSEGEFGGPPPPPPPKSPPPRRRLPPPQPGVGGPPNLFWT